MNTKARRIQPNSAASVLAAINAVKQARTVKEYYTLCRTNNVGLGKAHEFLQKFVNKQWVSRLKLISGQRLLSDDLRLAALEEASAIVNEFLIQKDERKNV